MFCLNYYPHKKYDAEVGELRIRYNPADRTLEPFLEKYKDKSIVIDVADTFEDIDADLLAELLKKTNNFKLIIDYNNKEALKRVQDRNLPFFFGNFVTTIDQMHGLIPYHPTDMYICEELGFFLDRVSEILHSHDIKVRVFPNICQSSFADTPSMKTFFIRPEDIPNYKPFVDVFELIDDEKRQGVIFKVYNECKWFGPIKEIIPSFEDELDSRFLHGSFGAIRVKCGKRCYYKLHSCDICDRFIELANTFKDQGIVVQVEKRRPPVDDEKN